MYSFARLNLASPVTLNLPTVRSRVAAVGVQPAAPTGGSPRTFSGFDIAFVTDATTRAIHAMIAPLHRALRIYGPADFASVAADTPDQHLERVRQILGDDPQAALQLLADGSEMPPLPARVPREIANWRAKAVLESMGLTSGVEAFLAALPEPQRTVAALAWNGDAKMVRESPMVNALANALELTPEQVDAMFIAAEAITI